MARELERTFQTWVISAARLNGWRVAHFRPITDRQGRTRTPVLADAAGFPDLTLAHRRRGAVIFAELKQDGAYPTPKQRGWLEDLQRAAGSSSNLLTVVWRPKDRDRIVATLLNFGA